MDLLKIYKRAYYHTLTLFDEEAERLQKNPENNISIRLLNKYNEECKYLHNLIVELEKKNFIYNA